MPENNVSDPITDQEIAFAHLVFSGTMTDRRAAKAVGLHPDSANNTKSKPRVRAYMLKHHAAAQQQRVEQDTDLSRLPRLAVGRAVDGQPRLNVSRDQVLDRLWEIANLSPEMTRGSITGQVKALSIIVAIEGLIPDRRAAADQSKSVPPPVTPQIYQAECPPRPAVGLSNRQSGENVKPEPPPPAAQEEPASQPQSAPGWADDAPPVSGPHPGPTPEPTPDLSQPPFSAAPSNPAPTPSLAPRVPTADYVTPDTRVPFSMRKNPFLRRR
jgi:hypothetical protein